MAWVRTGECCRCGQCCRGGVVVDNLPEQADGSCPYLEPEQNGERRCRIHDIADSYWGRGCNEWPTVPHHIQDYDRCTYRFHWVDD